MRILLLTLFAFTPNLGTADVWTPPENPDPSAILQEARADTDAGRYEVALAKHLWYHDNAVKIQQGQSGVRLSFALSNWLELGEAYPPALEKMKQIRDETEQRIRDEDRVRVRFDDFHDFVAFNRTLREEERTAETFEWLDGVDAEDARRMFQVAQPALIKQKAYELCGKYIDLEKDLSRIRDHYTMGIKLAETRFGDRHREFTERKFLNEATTLVAILANVDRQADADRVAKELKDFVTDPELHAKLTGQLEPALKGTVPTPWP